MKTIFITLSDGEVSKTILHSSIYTFLHERYKLVLLVPARKVDYFRERYADEHTVVEASPAPRSLFVEEFFSDLLLYSLHTESIRIKIEHSYASGGSLVGKGIKLLLWNFGAVGLYRSLCRGLYHAFPEHSFDALFNTHRPDLVFAANLTSAEDARLLKTARRFGVRSLGMPKGWDNLTLKTLLPVFPDHLLVQTELMRQDAGALGYPDKNISVVGFPKFDIYADMSVIIPREEFIKRLGLNPQKKLILYAGAGDQLAPHDEEILSDFLLAIDSGEVADGPNVLVRPHPKYKYRADVLPCRDFWVLERPGHTVKGVTEGEFEFEQEDVIHLMNLLYHCDLLIHTASTLGVEAAVFDKPVVALAYDGHATVADGLSVVRYYRYEHIARVLATGGMPVARSFDELVADTNRYLADPTKDSVGRHRIVEENAYRIDGGAGQRVTKELARMLDIDVT